MSSRECSQPHDLDLLDLDIEFDPGTDDDDDLPTRRFRAPPAIARKVLRKIRPLPRVCPPPPRTST
jgi:hypothetical protein